MKSLKLFFSFFILSLLIVSCGADKLKQSSTPAKAISALGQQCSCDTSYIPVCGSNSLTYENICTANCYKVYETAPGNCECSDSLMVCGDNGQTYTECAAGFKISSGEITKIVKYAPCGAATM